MAANLAGMFAQLNNAIQNSPVEEAQGLLDMTSQGFGGVAGALSGADPYSFMNQGAKQLQGQQDLGALDMSTVEEMKQAAQVYQKTGKQAEALKLLEKSRLLEESQRVQFMQNQEDIDLMSARTHAMSLALRDGDRAGHAMLKTGQWAPGEYIRDRQKPVDPLVVADGSTAVDPTTGTVIYENKKAPKMSAYAQEGADLGYPPGSPESMDYIRRRVGMTGVKSSPLSAAGKQLVDEGSTYNTPEYRAELSRRTRRDTPRAWRQYQEVSDSISSSPVFKQAEENALKAQGAGVYMAEALNGNTKAIPLLESSMATLIQSSVKAQAEIENIRSANNIAGRFLDSVSKGITGQLTKETLVQYQDVLTRVLQVAGNAKSEYVNRMLASAATTGMPDDVVNNVRDSFGIQNNTSNWVDRK